MNMADLNTFSRNMRMIVQAIEINSITAVREVAKAVGTTVVYATPVDTSRARLNWQGSVALPKAGVLLAAPLQPPSSNYGRNIALSSINQATIAYNGQKGGIWITNNLDYIQDLNNGSSRQAPANFVAMAVLTGINAVSKVRLLP